MLKYLHLFETESEFNQERNGNYREPWTSLISQNGRVDYNKTEYEKLLGTPFTIEATEDETTIYFRQSSYAVSDGLDPLEVEVSTDDGETWTEVTAAVAGGGVSGAVLAELDEGEKVLIRGNNGAYGYYSRSEAWPCENCNFRADKPCYIYGNIMSLVDSDDFAGLRTVNNYAFAYFFSDYDGLDLSWVLTKEGEARLLHTMRACLWRVSQTENTTRSAYLINLK